MQNFHPNPLVVKSNGVPYRLIELALDIEEQDFTLEVLDKNKTLIQRHTMDATSLIALDKSYGEVTLVYKDKAGNILEQETINLNHDGKKVELEKKNDDLKMKLENLIKQQMDFPNGTEAEINHHTEMLKKATTDANARLYVVAKIRTIIVSSNLVPPNEVENNVYEQYANLYGMGILQELDDDEAVGEIMVNASVFPRFKSDIYYIKEGKKYKFDKDFANLEELKQVFARSVEFNKKELNSVENAIVEATRANKDRVNILIPQASENYILNIRKFSNFVPNLDMMRKSGTVNDQVEKIMRALVQGKSNIGIGGEMGTGKTTFINFLLTYTEPIERKVVIASVSETDVERVLKGHDVVILNVDDDKGFTFDKQIRASLRTTASRVIIPESRGGEFKQVYEANLKTKGNMFTAHALDDVSFLDMCVDMYLSSADSANESSEYIKHKLSKSIDVIIIMRKVGDKIRIKSISEVLLDEKRNYAGMNVLFKWSFNPENPLEGHYVTGNHMSDELKLRLNENGVPMSQLKDL
ncbi:ATPase, T2SS/T4P/T4SS family (plasmid) [Aneurinibacillus sp. Ricciae_BoGa-3]|uniref:ATPase, T2SS/T4P/T4SS family n=1 Tax=Aneurinibacillus sp. Ricciae_BoGa-3 TaxID=3022697 RepID=UPI0023404E3A|nr:ATPase, T2SS/T4P/T4SS family [Aneurinibacillus sp. Ricciae_BoGa-3]WCK57696.1 ATPase, T2SS/T4P/T4SS family [Aneurinibacillus sp. Ricciae_BoGa-3]